METKDFLLEIGVEEIPAGYISNAVQKMHDFFTVKFAELELAYKQFQLFSTPRRFALLVKELQTSQADVCKERIGPTRAVAYDSSGNLTPAAQGFLRSTGATEEDIYLVNTSKGDKIAVKFEKQGSATIDLLQKLIPEVIDILPFPKKMKWKTKNLDFARPVRWILSLSGDQTIQLEFKGLKTGDYTYGNRFLSLDKKIKIAKISEYENKLLDNFVIADRKKRQQILQNRIDALLKSSNLELVEDGALMQTVTDLVEHPQPVLAEFDNRYLSLPEKIITSTLSQHQKYFSLADKKGNLTNNFLFVSNGDPQYDDLIRIGNEKVIKARLEDAEFFYKEDTKIPLSEFVVRLSDVTFQEKLGSVLEKTERIEKISDLLSDLLKLPDFVKAKTLRTAKLCKADLVTLMLGEKEFTKLQGYIGWKYAEKSNEQHPVPLAIFEHYLPRWQNDQLPDTMEGSIVAIADKLDTICGIIGVGLIPTGSKDPYALRRAANGIVQIMAEKGFEIDLSELISKAFQNLREKLEKPDNNIDYVFTFMKQRINWYLQEKGIDYDVIESVMHIDHNNIPDLIKRAMALQELKNSSSFIKLVTGFKRVSNIIEKFQSQGTVKQELLQEGTEIQLYEEFLILQKSIAEILKTKEYSKILDLLINYGRIIDDYFDNVLVNVEDMKLRTNRYELLLLIRKLFLKVADLSKIVIEGE